jgi:hypothetical protein
MKKTALVISSLLLTVCAIPASADKWVNGYTKKDGTYVQGHMKSSPDSSRYNNKGSQTYGGSQRDEYSSGPGATNQGNSSYGYRDNDNDGLSNSFDPKPESKKNW